MSPRRPEPEISRSSFIRFGLKATKILVALAAGEMVGLSVYRNLIDTSYQNQFPFDYALTAVEATERAAFFRQFPGFVPVEGISRATYQLARADDPRYAVETKRDVGTRHTLIFVSHPASSGTIAGINAVNVETGHDERMPNPQVLQNLLDAGVTAAATMRPVHLNPESHGITRGLAERHLLREHGKLATFNHSAGGMMAGNSLQIGYIEPNPDRLDILANTPLRVSDLRAIPRAVISLLPIYPYLAQQNLYLKDIVNGTGTFGDYSPLAQTSLFWNMLAISGEGGVTLPENNAIIMAYSPTDNTVSVTPPPGDARYITLENLGVPQPASGTHNANEHIVTMIEQAQFARSRL